MGLGLLGEWLAWQLEAAGYRVELDVWDWAPGEDFVARMQAALERAERLGTDEATAAARLLEEP